MPYEKVSIMVAMVISVVLSVMLAGNFSKDAGVVVIDLDNSAYTHELTNRIDASEYMKVTAVVNTPADRVPSSIGTRRLPSSTSRKVSKKTAIRGRRTGSASSTITRTPRRPRRSRRR